MFAAFCFLLSAFCVRLSACFCLLINLLCCFLFNFFWPLLPFRDAVDPTFGSQDLAVAIAFEEDGEVAPVPLADPLMDRVFPLAEACIKDLGPELELLR